MSDVLITDLLSLMFTCKVVNATFSLFICNHGKILPFHIHGKIHHHHQLHCYHASHEKKMYFIVCNVHVNMYIYNVHCTCNYGWDDHPWQLMLAALILTSRNEIGLSKLSLRADDPVLHLTHRTQVRLAAGGSTYEVKALGVGDQSNVIVPSKIKETCAQSRKADSLFFFMGSTENLLLWLGQVKFRKIWHSSQSSLSVVGNYTVARDLKWAN